MQNAPAGEKRENVITLHEVESEVDIECDGCGEIILDDVEIYCAECATRPHKPEAQCSKCLKRFPGGELFTKITGLLCHHCAFIYEATCAGLLAKEKAAK